MVHQQFWWPSIKEDVKVYVEACPVCSQGKCTRLRSQGLLHLLPIPCRPSHIFLDFVTRLPPSQGNTGILVVADRFSKAARFIPLPKLPSPKREQSSSWNMSSGCLEFPWILSPTEGPSFRPGSEGPSASWLGPQPAYRLGSIQSLMAILNGLTRIWRPLCGVWRPITPPFVGNIIWAEYDHNTLQSSATDLSPFECQFRLMLPRPGVLSNAVGTPGGRLVVPFLRPPRDINVRLIAAFGWPLISELVKESS